MCDKKISARIDFELLNITQKSSEVLKECCFGNRENMCVKEKEHFAKKECFWKIGMLGKKGTKTIFEEKKLGE